MSGRVRRIFVERRQEFALKAQSLCRDLKENLQVAGLEAVRIVYRYDFSGVTRTKHAGPDILFAELLTNLVYEEELTTFEGAQVFAVEYLPVQFDQQADLTAQCLQALTGRERPPVRTARVFVLQGRISPAELDRIKAYVSNAVDSREASLEKPPHLETEAAAPADVAVLEGFNARRWRCRSCRQSSAWPWMRKIFCTARLISGIRKKGSRPSRSSDLSIPTGPITAGIPPSRR